MATVTFTTATPMQPKYRINSVHEVMQRIASTATWSAGDVYILNNLKIPDRAVVTGMQVWGSVPDGTYLIEIGAAGSGGSLDVFGSLTLSATAVANSVRTVGIPYTVSCSDDATLRYQTLAIRVDGAATSGTASVSVNVLVKYIMR